MSARIGRLRHRLKIEREARTPDGGGGAAVAWEELAEVWGAVETMSGKETVSADRVAGEASCLITIRHRSDIAPAMRFRRGEEILHILSVLDKDGRKRFLACQCERRDL
jgi:SPP1 family predicted phage head-tail adaptor